MSTPLKDPNKPAHAIVKVHDDGSALRNDGEVLQAANSNPWYVLATVFGEQAEGAEIWKYNKELAAKNRRAWNGWACAGLSEVERQDRAEKVGLAVEDLKPLRIMELDEIKTRFQNRMGKGVQLPERTEPIDFANTYFSNPTLFDQFIFVQKTTFVNAVFGRPVLFKSAMFNGAIRFNKAVFNAHADFDSATFNGAEYSETTYFNGATFNDNVTFESTEFSGYADFNRVTFNGDVNFDSATFKGFADFSSVMFINHAWFQSVTFKSTTQFKDAIFKTKVPEFYASELYDETVFTLPDNYLDNWPAVSGSVEVPAWGAPIDVMPAADQKRAYNRLRLFMNRALQFDEEQFFHRQEMRCKQEEAKGVHVVIFMLFDALSDYGNSIERPAAWLFILWIWGAIAKLNAVGGGSFWPDYHSIPHALGWSLSNLFTVFGFWRLYAKEFLELNSWLQLIGSAQTVCGFALLFLLGLGLRNRFRLR